MLANGGCIHLQLGPGLELPRKLVRPVAPAQNDGAPLGRWLGRGSYLEVRGCASARGVAEVGVEDLAAVVGEVGADDAVLVTPGVHLQEGARQQPLSEALPAHKPTRLHRLGTQPTDTEQQAPELTPGSPRDDRTPPG